MKLQDSNQIDQQILQKSINKDIQLLDIFNELSDFFMLDYYTGEGYNLLIKSWYRVAKEHGREFLVNLVLRLLSKTTTENSGSVMMPLSLLSFISLLKHRIGKRAYCPLKRCKVELQGIRKEQLRFLKPKKIVEIESLLPCVEQLVRSGDITHIVDIGAGLGHASRFIASQFPQCTVLRIEAQGLLVEKAQNIDLRFSNKSKNLNIYSTVCRLNLDDDITKSFMDILADVDSQNSTNFSSSRILLLGLHPCGNLGSYMLKLFSGCAVCHGILIVSCCYMYIDADGSSSGGFPLSRHVQDKEYLKLPEQVKQQACHNIECYLNRLLESLKTPADMSQHWRSIADIFIAKRDPNYSRTCFKFKKRKNQEDIVEFINKNLKFHEMKLLDTEEIETAVGLRGIEQSISWVYYLVYIMKITLGLVGESLILADRALFLLENAAECSLEPIFDPMESPRNTAIIATKRKSRNWGY